ncbi:MAG: HupE/UreJ family protein [Candidatus Pelagadaptatus aseana]|uniref:HupE/UreJ family protein n=1 Tax=Candidatus Pelagadaptatus aseana TaxID=3120508 RepID=UPI0039B164AD
MNTSLLYRLVAPLLMLLLSSVSSQAHESRPLYIEISERSVNGYAVSWRIPPSAANVASPKINMPDDCQARSKPRGTAILQQQFFQCQSDLSDATLTIHWPEYNPSISTLLRFERLSGENHSAILGPDTLQWQIPNREDSASVAWEYLVLGVEHILLGPDHLLFVACLVFIAGSFRRILLTITGFTLSHSLTLILATLEVVTVPIVAVETVIALSIVFLATEIARGYTGEQPAARRNTLTWRYPVLVASSFGLLHGFGFASVLTEIGLPQTELPIALLFFNLGVELGQILFILMLVITFKLLIRLGQTQEHNEIVAGSDHDFSAIEAIPQPLLMATIYSIGLLASFWMFDRLINGLL